jgi:drug/metabolite transporter (DMT)-like permease
MAVGAMGIVAPISAASPVVPLGVDLLRGNSPAALQWLGIVLAVGGIVVLSHEPRGESGRLAAGVGLALVAALGFGFFVVGIDATADESAVWATWAARLVAVLSVALAVVTVRVRPVVPRRLLPTVAAVGVFDTGANVLIAIATTKGLIGVVAVLSALYPVMTIALARVVLHERLDGWKRGGAALALGGAALVAVG